MTKRSVSFNYPIKLVFLSLAGLVAAVWQAAERVHMLKNPGGPLACDLSPIVDCGTVLGHRLSALFGFPNAFIGIVFFSMLLALGLSALMGNELKKIRPLLLGLSTILLGFSLWFFGVSVYIIGKICIFCIVIWLTAVPLFAYTLREYLMERKVTGYLATVRDFLDKRTPEAILTAYVILTALFLFNFRDYYF